MGSGSVSLLVSQKVSETLSKENVLEMHHWDKHHYLRPTPVIAWGALGVPGPLFHSLAPFLCLVVYLWLYYCIAPSLASKGFRMSKQGGV